MASVRVLATRVGSTHVYKAEIFDDIEDDEPIWMCEHDHASPIDAQSCGLHQLTRLVGGEHLTPA
jgi:hypothetical protein